METLEDYLSTSDSMSLLSLDMTNNSLIETESELSYVGFSAQSSTIPSISCDSALKKRLSAEKMSSTSSSSPMISAPTSPDNDSVTAKKSSGSDEDETDDRPTTAKVLSGIFETFDNLLWKI